ncbi:HK97 gp10 family phage protein [Mesorhizobium sp. B2-4-4]|uniref:HK97-gp10 family putative phage morphogenesis protein n=1 Tax=Mesorhizobium sp. B2-4-4 TaxID=2589945 RepID=UPI001126790D|nr:HK97-gp10 family putative phage morphogenesis protein [Mesorhizobium sp. B2-4-4]TPL52042.1 HK97 gp10 family phage protein [Mesorhizobium sp. B2-4-4]
MAKLDNGLAGLNAALDRILKDAETKITPALLRSGREFADTAKALAESSRDTGALIDSIAVTPPSASTPPYSQPGGMRVAGPTEVIVTAGNEDVRYPHLVEWGTSKMEAEPFWVPAWRLSRPRILNRVRRLQRQIVRWKSQ